MIRDISNSVRPWKEPRGTRETLAGIRPAFGQRARVESDSSLYGASAERLFTELRRLDDQVTTVVLIEHNPGVADLVDLLAVASATGGAAIDTFPTAAVAVLSVAGPWSASATGLCVTRQLLGAAAGALIDVSGMDITTIRARVEQARVARLATVRPDGRPHVVPCCFVLSNEVLYSAVDANPKSTVALRRLDNVRAVPWAAPMLVDHYTDAATTMLEMLGVRSSNSSAALSMPPTRNAPSHSRRTCTPPGSTS